MAIEWYVQSNGQVFGPFTPSKLKALAQHGKIGPEAQVRKGKEGKWASATRVTGLFSELTTPDRTTARKPQVDAKPLDLGASESSSISKAVSSGDSPKQVEESFWDELGLGDAEINEPLATPPQNPSVPKFSNPNLRPCPDCSHEVSKRAKQCLHCGCPLDIEGVAHSLNANTTTAAVNDEPRRRSSIPPGVYVVVATIAVAGVVIALGSSRTRRVPNASTYTATSPPPTATDTSLLTSSEDDWNDFVASAKGRVGDGETWWKAQEYSDSIELQITGDDVFVSDSLKYSQKGVVTITSTTRFFRNTRTEQFDLEFGRLKGKWELVKCEGKTLFSTIRNESKDIGVVTRVRNERWLGLFSNIFDATGFGR